MFLDHIIMSFAIVSLLALLESLIIVDNQLLVAIGLGIYVNKDILNGRSPAKFILKLQVVNKTTGVAADALKCFLRNLFVIIWPVEVVVAFLTPQSRIGDRLAGTRVVKLGKDKAGVGAGRFSSGGIAKPVYAVAATVAFVTAIYLISLKIF